MGRDRRSWTRDLAMGRSTMSTIADALASLTRTLNDARDLVDRHADPLTVDDLLRRARKLLEIVEEMVVAESAAQSIEVPGATRGALAQLRKQIDSLGHDAG
jgi:hypothetical protein